MIRTQIQLPENLYATAKLMAQQGDTTLAEIIRRAMEEYFMRRPGAVVGQKDWVFPVGRSLGIREDIDWSAVKDDLYARDPFKNRDDQ